MRKVFIYHLIDPRNNLPFYVGRTFNISERYNGHLKEKGNNKKNNLIKSLKRKGLKPIIEIIEEVTENDWVFWEMYYICLYKSWNLNILNCTLGGEGINGLKHSEDSKLKISNAQKGRKVSDEWKQNISKGKKGIKFTEEHIKNLSLSHAGQINQNLLKAVYQIDRYNGQILNKYESISNALRDLKISLKDGTISSVCKGKLKSAHGFYWCYVDNYENYKFIPFKLNIVIPETAKSVAKIDMLTNDIVSIYRSLKNAGEMNSIDRITIKRGIKKNKAISGFLWKFA